MANRMTQREMVMKYLNENGSITPAEAYTEIGTYKLATIISELIHECGVHNIKKELMHGRNRYGQPCTFMRYELVKESNSLAV